MDKEERLVELLEEYRLHRNACRGISAVKPKPTRPKPKAATLEEYTTWVDEVEAWEVRREEWGRRLAEQEEVTNGAKLALISELNVEDVWIKVGDDAVKVTSEYTLKINDWEVVR